MAEQKTTRKRTTTNTVVETPIEENKELVQAKAENAQLLAMLQLLQKEIDEIKNNNSNNSQNVVVKQDDVTTRTFKVISMIPNTYVLSTQYLGRGKVFVFEKYGDSNLIRYSELQDILSIYLSQFEEGCAILSTKEEYEALGIGYIYDSIIQKDAMDSLICLKKDEDVDIILNLSDEMQDNVIRLIAEKMNNGYSYDYNKIKQLENNGFNISEIVDMLDASKE